MQAKVSLTYENSDSDTEFVISSGPEDLTNTNYFSLAPQRDDIVVFSGRVDYQLESGTFSSITGYVDRERFDGGQEGGLSFFFLFPTTNAFNFNEESISQEFRYVSNTDGPLNFLTGIYYKSGEMESDIILNSAHPLLPGTVLDEDEFYDSEQISVFGELSYSLTQNLTTTVGLRYFKEDVDSKQSWFDPDVVFAGFPDFTFEATITVEEVLPKVLVEYTPTDAFLLYGSASKGARNGGLNTTSTISIANAFGRTLPRTFAQDTAWSYEVGAKSQWLDQKLTANISLYYIDWSNLQSAVSDPATSLGYVENGGDAFTQGLELDLVYQVSDAIDLYFAGNISEAELKEDFVFSAAATSPKGSPLPQTPDFAISIGADASYPLDKILGSRLDFVVHADYQIIGKRATVLDSMPADPNFFEAEQYDIFNFRAGIQGESWGLSLFANNLFDERAVLNKAGISPSGFLNDVINRPRTTGISVDVSF